MQLFLSWNDDVTLSEVTKPRYGSVYPWPLNVILSWKKRSQVKKKLTALGWGNKSLEEVRVLFNINRDSRGMLNVKVSETKKCIKANDFFHFRYTQK